MGVCERVGDLMANQVTIPLPHPIYRRADRPRRHSQLRREMIILSVCWFASVV